MEWSIIQKPNLLQIKTDTRNDSNFSLQKELYYKILSNILLNRQISLLTLQPQSYSLGYEIKGSSENMKIANTPFLINSRIECNSKLLLDIIASEEFRRSLLFIINQNSIDYKKISFSIVNFIDNEQSISFDVENSIYYTENNGNTLCLYNSKITYDKLESLLINY